MIIRKEGMVGYRADEEEEDVEFGGFWIRVGAYFIDFAVLLIPILLVSFLFRATSPAANTAEKAAVKVIDFLMNMIIWWIYTAAFHSSIWQATVGKKLVGLKVVDYNGDRISFGRATGRYFAGILSGIILGIGFMMVGWTKRKQGLHDMIAETLVVKSR